jgi:hypothetical protein
LPAAAPASIPSSTGCSAGHDDEERSGIMTNTSHDDESHDDENDSHECHE